MSSFSFSLIVKKMFPAQCGLRTEHSVCSMQCKKIIIKTCHLFPFSLIVKKKKNVSCTVCFRTEHSVCSMQKSKMQRRYELFHIINDKTFLSPLYFIKMLALNLNQSELRLNICAFSLIRRLLCVL